MMKSLHLIPQISFLMILCCLYDGSTLKISEKAFKEEKETLTNTCTLSQKAWELFFGQLSTVVSLIPS